MLLHTLLSACSWLEGCLSGTEAIHVRDEHHQLSCPVWRLSTEYLSTACHVLWQLSYWMSYGSCHVRCPMAAVLFDILWQLSHFMSYGSCALAGPATQIQSWGRQTAFPTVRPSAAHANRHPRAWQTQLDSVREPAGLFMLAALLLIGAAEPPGHHEPAMQSVQLSPNVPAASAHTPSFEECVARLCGLLKMHTNCAACLSCWMLHVA
jgi:hypothetical protein